MLGMTRFTPWTELAGLHRDLDSWFGRAFGEPGGRQAADLPLSSFTPPADVRREADKWMVSIAVPGIAPESLNIDVVGRTLRVRGERGAGQKADALLSEIVYGRFEREFTLPEEIDAKHVEATYRYGMLELVLPLSEGAKPHRVEVKASTEGKRLTAA